MRRKYGQVHGIKYKIEYANTYVNFAEKVKKSLLFFSALRKAVLVIV